MALLALMVGTPAWLPIPAAAQAPTSILVSWGQQVIPLVLPGTGYKSVSGGYQHSLALLSNGTVVVWGDNTYGQATIPDGLTNVMAASAGYYHNLALQPGGTVVAWGGARLGGVGPSADYGQATVPGGLTGVVAVAAGGYFSLALQANGTIVGWGDNTYGQTTAPGGLGTVTALAAGSYHALALRAGGTVVAWGDNDAGATNVPSGLTGVTAIAAGSFHNLALKQDGTVVAWGRNNSGESDVPSGLSNVVAIAAGFEWSLALQQNGTLVAWGDNSYGQTPAPSGLGSIAAIAAGGLHGLVLRPDGTVAAWGDDEFAQATVPGSRNGFIALAAGANYGLGLKPDGTVQQWGGGPTFAPPAGLSGVTAIAAGDYHNLALLQNGTVAAWGDNTYGESTVPSGLANVVGIACGDYHSLAVKHDGTVAAWGCNVVPNIGGYVGQSVVPGGLNQVIAVAGGFEQSLALKANGTVVAWGGNDADQTNVPTGLSGVTAVAAGFDQSLTLLQNGTVVAWGDDHFGDVPMPSGLSGVTALTAGHTHNVALGPGGTVVAWGDNTYGQSTVPPGLAGLAALEIAAGYTHTLALVSYAPVIGPAPTNQSLAVGLTATLSAAVKGVPPLTCQWFFNGVNPVPGATTSTLTLTNVQTSQAGTYVVVVTNAFGAVTSAPATLTVLGTPPALASQPAGGTMLAGAQGPILFSVTATGALPLGYQWYFDGTQALAGATASSLQLSNIQPAQAGTYLAVVTNAFGAVTSSPAVLTVVTPGIVPACTDTALRLAMTGVQRVSFACGGTITLAGTITIADDIVFDGSGHQITLSGGGTVRPFYVPPHLTLTLSNLTIAGGYSQDGQGGGAILNDGTLQVAACTFVNNCSAGLSGQFGQAGGLGCGGAICTTTTGSLDLSASTFWQNTAVGGSGSPGASGDRSGAGIFHIDGYPGGNGGSACGAAVYTAGAASIVNCTFVANQTTGGPGANGGNGGYWILNAHDTEFGAAGSGGNGGPARGAAVYATGWCGLTNCTLAENSAFAGSGGLGGVSFLGQPAPSGTLGTATAAVSGPTLVNTLLAANSSGDSFTDSGGNLISTTTTGLLAPLANNGGPTLTMALLPFSSAIDAANTAAAPPIDQRGVPRPSGPAADIGAYEYTGCWPPTLLAPTVLGPSGPVVLHVAGTNGCLVRLLASTTLTNWTPIATNQCGPNGNLSFRLPLTSDRQRFFRIVSP